MIVNDLIELLQTMDQDAIVNIYPGHDPEFGEWYSEVGEIEQKPVGWDDVNNKQIMEVYIL
jgi:hypothetical protein